MPVMIFISLPLVPLWGWPWTGPSLIRTWRRVVLGEGGRTKPTMVMLQQIDYRDVGLRHKSVPINPPSCPRWQWSVLDSQHDQRWETCAEYQTAALGTKSHNYGWNDILCFSFTNVVAFKPFSLIHTLNKRRGRYRRVSPVRSTCRLRNTLTFGKYCHSLHRQDIDEKVDTMLVSAWRWSQELVGCRPARADWMTAQVIVNGRARDDWSDRDASRLPQALLPVRRGNLWVCVVMFDQPLAFICSYDHF